MKRIRVINICANLLFVLLMIIVVPLSIPRFFGYEIYHVLTDSMEPSISTGSIIYVQPVDFNQLKVGDVISYNAKHKSVVTHRIVDIKNSSITTKGDHNQEVDMQQVKEMQVNGKVIYSIPLLGYISSLFNKSSTVFIQFVLLFVIIIMWTYCYKKGKE